MHRIREERYTSNDMRRYLFHLKDNGWINEFQWDKQHHHNFFVQAP